MKIILGNHHKLITWKLTEENTKDLIAKEPTTCFLN